MSIHSTAIISPEAEIASDVSIGPFSVVRGRVRIGAGTIIENNTTIGSEFGSVELGKNNHVLSGAVIGGPPQDLSYKNEAVQLIVGDGNVFREFVTVNQGTVKGGGVTSIGNENMLMAYVHIAHDCIVKNDVVIANSSHFAGHVEVDDHVKIGGGCLISQFCKLGEYAYIAGDSTINKDILPFTIAQGKYAVMRATNKVGMERANFSKSDIENIHKAIRFIIKGDRTVDEALEKIETECVSSDKLQVLIQFLKSSSRGIAR